MEQVFKARFQRLEHLLGLQRSLLVILLAISSPVLAGESDALIGTWKLVSWQVIVDNEPLQNVFGSNPKGYLVLTREGSQHRGDDRRQP